MSSLEKHEGLAYFLVREPDLMPLRLLPTPTKTRHINSLGHYIKPTYHSKEPLKIQMEPLKEPKSIPPPFYERTETLPSLPDFVGTFSMRNIPLPTGEAMAVISYDSKTGVYRVERGYIPGKNPNKIMEAEGRKLEGLQSLATIVEQAIKYERETGSPVVIRPAKLPEMKGDVLYPANGIENVILYAINRPLSHLPLA